MYDVADSSNSKPFEYPKPPSIVMDYESSDRDSSAHSERDCELSKGLITKPTDHFSNKPSTSGISPRGPAHTSSPWESRRTDKREGGRSFDGRVELASYVSSI